MNAKFADAHVRACSLTPPERARMGVSSLRRFLEVLLRDRYMASVPTMLPLLEKEVSSA